jgi:hypothetical protein
MPEVNDNRVSDVRITPDNATARNSWVLLPSLPEHGRGMASI